MMILLPMVSVVFHNYLGNSLGEAAVFDGDGGAFTSKLNGSGALMVDEYNCGQCHSADPDSVDGSSNPNITVLEAMQLHTASGGGSGDCLTCHTFAAVADEITAGIGGVTQNCEDCHATANGNGPSGEAMYQYDGIRHHKTAHAQAGDCTWCHADARPAAPTQSGAYAATTTSVASNNTANAVSTTGWITDYSMTAPASFPDQPGCRLCHTNYEVYSVDMQSQSNHGYNLGNVTTGLTVFANNYLANATNTYPSGNGNLDVASTEYVTQTAVHRIDDNSAASKILVVDYGACFACHSVQMFHAAPEPGSDFTAATSGGNNNVPFDSLRNAPGRGLFNLFRGDRGDTTQDWDDHAMEPEPFSRGWENQRGEDAMSGRGTSNFDGRGTTTEPTVADTSFGNSASNWTQIDIPGDSAVNNYEGLSGIPTNGSIYTGEGIVNFTDGPVTSAIYDGDSIDVVAWNDYADTVNLTFTYSDDAGCTNVAMTWVGPYWTGTCATTTYSAPATVTVNSDAAGGGSDIMTVNDNSNAIPVAVNDPYTTTYSVSINDDV
jgi:hypothetical protein